MFRGFTNIGDDVGYLFAVLGGDDPGRVLWAPEVFDMAAKYGLVLLENGSLIDTAAGQSVPDGAIPMATTTAEQVAALHVPTAAEAEALVVRTAPSSATIIGPGAPLGWPHPFTLDRMIGVSDRATPSAPEVLFVHAGTLAVAWDGGRLNLSAGDTMTVPVGLERTLAGDAVVYRVAGIG